MPSTRATAPASRPCQSQSPGRAARASAGTTATPPPERQLPPGLQRERGGGARAPDQSPRERNPRALGRGPGVRGRGPGVRGRGQNARGWSAEPGSVRGGALLRGGGQSAWGWRWNAGAQGRGHGGREWAPGTRRRDLGTEWAGRMLRRQRRLTPRLPWVLQLLSGGCYQRPRAGYAGWRVFSLARGETCQAALRQEEPQRREGRPRRKHYQATSLSLHHLWGVGQDLGTPHSLWGRRPCMSGASLSSAFMHSS